MLAVDDQCRNAQASQLLAAVTGGDDRSPLPQAAFQGGGTALVGPAGDLAHGRLVERVGGGSDGPLQSDRLVCGLVRAG